MIDVLRCACCKNPFSYEPSDSDFCPPGTPNMICDGCYASLKEDFESGDLYSNPAVEFVMSEIVKYQCDRCRSEIDKPADALAITLNPSGTFKLNTETIHLCPDCQLTFVEWLKEKRK